MRFWIISCPVVVKYCCSYLFPRVFKNYSRTFPSFSWGIFAHVTHVDQSRASENIWWIISVNIASLQFFISFSGNEFYCGHVSPFYGRRRRLLVITLVLFSCSKITLKESLLFLVSGLQVFRCCYWSLFKKLLWQVFERGLSRSGGKALIFFLHLIKKFSLNTAYDI